MVAKRKYLMANLVYGQPYTQLFLDNQIKSLLDPTNLPALAKDYELQFILFTDDETFPNVTRHPAFIALSRICRTDIVKLNWPPDADRFNSRYALLVDMFKRVLNEAFAREAYATSVWVADLVFAKECLPKLMSRIELGHDAVFNVPIRGAADFINLPLSQMQGAPTAMELFDFTYRALHHLWVASHWDAPLFTRMPYSMLWNSYSGLIAHNFGITPIIFRPLPEMKNVKGVIDADVPSFCKNPYWATDWVDAPVAGVEPLSNGHYPPFNQHRASIDYVVKWAPKGTQPCQVDYLDKPLFYPSKRAIANDGLIAAAQGIANEIQLRLREGK